MDEGTDAKDILENKLLPLRRGEGHTHPDNDTFSGVTVVGATFSFFVCV